jgi:hypothetical protein
MENDHAEIDHAFAFDFSYCLALPRRKLCGFNHG